MSYTSAWSGTGVLADDLLGGSKAMHQQGEQYLRRFYKESDEDYLLSPVPNSPLRLLRNRRPQPEHQALPPSGGA